MVLHKWAIMLIFSNVANATSLTARQIIFKITIKSLMLAIFDFEISKIAAVLSSQWTFLHIYKVTFFLLFWVSICSASHANAACTYIITILIIEGAVWDIIRNFAHTFWIDRHGLMSFLSHSKYFTHLGRGWCCTADSTLEVIILVHSISLAQLLEIWMLQCLTCT